MKKDCCFIINIGFDGCYSTSLIPRTTNPLSDAQLILDNCVKNSNTVCTKVEPILKELITINHCNFTRVINLTLHDIYYITKTLDNMKIHNFLGEPWKLKCVNCNLTIDYNELERVTCPKCGKPLKIKVKLLGDRLEAEKIIEFLHEISNCDSIILIGNEIKVEPLKSIISSIRKYWEKEIVLYHVDTFLLGDTSV